MLTVKVSVLENANLTPNRKKLLELASDLCYGKRFSESSAVGGSNPLGFNYPHLQFMSS